MNMPNSAESPSHTRSQLWTDGLPSWLRGRRGLVVLGVLALGLGAAFNWSWLVAAGAVPLLLSLLPCLAMCALGLCMKRMSGTKDKTSSTIAPEETDTTAPVEAPKSCCSSGQGAAPVFRR